MNPQQKNFSSLGVTRKLRNYHPAPVIFMKGGYELSIEMDWSCGQSEY